MKLLWHRMLFLIWVSSLIIFSSAGARIRCPDVFLSSPSFFYFRLSWKIKRLVIVTYLNGPLVGFSLVGKRQVTWAFFSLLLGGLSALIAALKLRFSSVWKCYLHAPCPQTSHQTQSADRFGYEDGSPSGGNYVVQVLFCDFPWSVGRYKARSLYWMLSSCLLVSCCSIVLTGMVVSPPYMSLTFL